MNVRKNLTAFFDLYLQSNTMPVLSLHNTYTLPSGSASYTLGLSGAPGVHTSYTLPTASGLGLGTSNLSGGLLSGAGATGLIGTGLSGTTGLHGGLASTGLSGIGGLGGTSSLIGGLGMSSTLPTNLTGLGTNTLYSTYTNPLLTSGVTSKLKALDDLDLAMARHRTISPLSPIPPTGWDIDRYGLDGVNPTYMHSHSRPLSRIGLDLDSKYENILCLWVSRCVEILRYHFNFSTTIRFDIQWNW